MKQKDKGIENDPPLGDGWAHWVANAPFKAYVKKYGHIVEVSQTLAAYASCLVNTFILSAKHMRLRLARC